MALEARARAERHDGHAVRRRRTRARAATSCGRLGEDDDVGPVRRVVREVGARAGRAPSRRRSRAARRGRARAELAPRGSPATGHGASLFERAQPPRATAACGAALSSRPSRTAVAASACTPAPVTDEDVRRLDGEQRARRREPQERLRRRGARSRAVVRRGTERLGAHERAVLREPERHLVPALSVAARGSTSNGAPARRDVGDDEMRHAEPVGEAARSRGRAGRAAARRPRAHRAQRTRSSTSSSATGSISQTPPPATSACEHAA